MQVQASQGQYLPSIDAGGSLQQKPFLRKHVKPDYYKNKRKQNYSNMYEVFDDDTQTLGRGHGLTSDYDSSQHPHHQFRRSHPYKESDDNRTIGTFMATDTSHKFGPGMRQRPGQASLQDKGKDQASRHSKGSVGRPAHGLSIDKTSESLHAVRHGVTQDGATGKRKMFNSKSRSPQLSSHRHNVLDDEENHRGSALKKTQTAKAGARQQRHPQLKKALSSAKALTRNSSKSPLRLSTKKARAKKTLQNTSARGSRRAPALAGNTAAGAEPVNGEVYGDQPLNLELSGTRHLLNQASEAR